MSYRCDADLEFLSKCSDSDLQDLFECLIKDKDGDYRLTEMLTTLDSYKQNYPHHSKYWKELADELQSFGGNTFVNFFRRGGVLYKEVLTDVCEKLNVNFNKNSSTELIERYMFQKLFSDVVENMDEADRKQLYDSISRSTADSILDYKPQALNSIAMVAFKAGGFASYKIAVIVANFVWKLIFGKGLSFVANQTLTKALSLWSGPIGWVITGAWTALDIAGPAYRVTIPAVIQVALLRMKIKEETGNQLLVLPQKSCYLKIGSENCH